MKAKKLINLNLLKEISGDDQSFKKEVIGIFRRDADVFQSFLMSPEYKKDSEELKRKAHKFKSSVLLFGVTAFIKILNEFESDTFKKLGDEKKELLAEKACQMLKQCEKELQKELKKLN